MQQDDGRPRCTSYHDGGHDDDVSVMRPLLPWSHVGPTSAKRSKAHRHLKTLLTTLTITAIVVLATFIFYPCIQNDHATPPQGKEDIITTSSSFSSPPDNTATTTHPSSTTTSSPSSSSLAYLVETLPRGDFDLQPLPGTDQTWRALIRLVDRTRNTLDITAMYWNLLAPPPPPPQHELPEWL